MTSPVTAGGDTGSTSALYTTIRRALLEYRGLDETQVADVLGAEPATRFFITRAPDDTPFPYGTMRLESTNDGKYHGMRLESLLEVQLYAKPWTQGDSIEGTADLIEEAMYGFLINSDGLAFCHGKQRATLPAGTDPADSEVYTVRLVFSLAIWPAYLTRLTQA